MEGRLAAPWRLIALLVVLVVLSCSLPGATAAATPSNPAALAPGTPGTAVVGSAQEFLAAMSDPLVTTISVTKPFAMPHGDPTVEPVVVQRNLLISSPHRAMIDWCDKQCRAGKMSKTPFIILGKVGGLALVRMGVLWCQRTTAGHVACCTDRSCRPCALLLHVALSRILFLAPCLTHCVRTMALQQHSWLCLSSATSNQCRGSSSTCSHCRWWSCSQAQLSPDAVCCAVSSAHGH